MGHSIGRKIISAIFVALFGSLTTTIFPCIAINKEFYAETEKVTHLLKLTLRRTLTLAVNYAAEAGALETSRAAVLANYGGPPKGVLTVSVF